jgi:putative YphP/YqiW family bacilliredoxin
VQCPDEDPELFVAPMRAELMRFGVEELRTPVDVKCRGQDDRRHPEDVVDSVGGYAAGKGRLGIAMACLTALGHEVEVRVRPTRKPHGAM